MGGAVVENAIGSALWVTPHFLLIYRDRRGVMVVIIGAPSLAAARKKAAAAGLNSPNSFRVGQELDAELVALLRSSQVGRILSAAEAKELLALFEARMSTAAKASPRGTDLRAAE
jgi:hypothetical protein